jgi:integrase
VNCRPVEYKIGYYPELTISQARTAAANASNIYRTGGDPHKDRIDKRHIATLKTLFDSWLEDAKLRKKSWPEDERIFKTYLARWHNKKLDSIKSANVAAWHNRLGKDNGRVQANRAKALLSTLYGYAPKIGYEGGNPCKGVANFTETSRERYLQADEMKAFFQAVMAEEQPWRDFFLLCLLTGQRRGNVASMQWVEIDLHNAHWTIPAAKSKAGKPITVALSPPALVILKRRHDEIEGTNPWVFGRKVDPVKAWKRVLEISGIENLRMHDLRRSLGSWQAALGASLSVIGKSLGHSDPQSTLVYSRLQLDPVRESVTKAGQAMIDAGGVVIEQRERL